MTTEIDRVNRIIYENKLREELVTKGEWVAVSRGNSTWKGESKEQLIRLLNMTEKGDNSRYFIVQVGNERKTEFDLQID